MTQQEKDLAELGLDAEALRAKTEHANELALKGAPDKPTRKPRADKGTKREPKAVVNTDEIVLRVTLGEARIIATELGSNRFALARVIQDQIIAQLQKRIDQLAKRGE